MESLIYCPRSVVQFFLKSQSAFPCSQAKIPNVKDLEVSIMDFDLLTSDDIVGTTTIDLENRLLTNARATVLSFYRSILRQV